MRFIKVLFYGAVILVALGFYFKRKADKDTIKGNGNVVQVERTTGEFHSVQISGGFEVIVKDGENAGLIVEADENLHDNITTSVSNGVLKVGMEGRIRNYDELKLYVQAPYFREIKVSGAVDLESDGELNSESLDLSGSGAAKVDIDVEVENLEVDFSGAGDIELKGEAGQVDVDLTGAGKFKGFDLETSNMDISISGAGYAEVNVSDKLDVNVSGAGKIRYKGNPQDVSKSISGAGSVVAE